MMEKSVSLSMCFTFPLGLDDFSTRSISSNTRPPIDTTMFTAFTKVRVGFTKAFSSIWYSYNCFASDSSHVVHAVFVAKTTILEYATETNIVCFHIECYLVIQKQENRVVELVDFDLSLSKFFFHRWVEEAVSVTAEAEGSSW